MDPFGIAEAVTDDRPPHAEVDYKSPELTVPGDGVLPKHRVVVEDIERATDELRFAQVDDTYDRLEEGRKGIGSTGMVLDEVRAAGTLRAVLAVTGTVLPFVPVLCQFLGEVRGGRKQSEVITE